MKNILFLIGLLMGIAQAASAQKEETIGRHMRLTGGFGALQLNFSRAGNDPGTGLGLQGAFVFRDVFLGLYFQGDRFGDRRLNNKNYNLGLGSSGLLLGYVYPSYKAVHVFATLKLGGGAAVLTRKDNDPFDGDDIRDGIRLITPALGVELNILHWMRLAGTLGYRWVSGVDHLSGVGSRDFNNMVVGITLRVGSFGD